MTKDIQNRLITWWLRGDSSMEEIWKDACIRYTVALDEVFDKEEGEVDPALMQECFEAALDAYEVIRDEVDN